MPDVRRMAALDLHGMAGRPLRRRLIGAEFVLGAAGCLGLGLWVRYTAAQLWLIVPLLFAGLALAQRRSA